MFLVSGRALFHSGALCGIAMVCFSCSSTVHRGNTTSNQTVQQTASNNINSRESIELHDLRVVKAGQVRSVAFTFSAEPNMLRQFELDNPKRLVMELDGPISKSTSSLGAFKPDDRRITEVRIGEFGKKLRLTIELANADLKYVLSKSQNKSIITQFRTVAESDRGMDAQILYFSENANFAHIQRTMEGEDWGSSNRPVNEISLTEATHFAINSAKKCRLAVKSR